MSKINRWRVIEVDLAAPLPELNSESGYDGVRVIYRLAGCGVGHADFTDSQLPLTPSQLAVAASGMSAAAIGDRLWSDGFRSALPGLPVPDVNDPIGTLRRVVHETSPLRKLIGGTDDASPRRHSITVAICTRNRAADLARCLESLGRSTEKPEEILVVDNAPDDESTRQLVARYPHVIYTTEPRLGLSAARNKALQCASSDIVAFTDDDVIVDLGWTARISRAFTGDKTMVVTGLILPAELETRAQLIFEKSLGFFHHGYRMRRFDASYFEALRQKGVHSWAIGAGANMAIRRAALEAGFRFDTRLGPGVFGGCGEDSESWYQLLAAGWECIYDPSAVVYHHHRRELSALRTQMKQYMKGHVASLLLQHRKGKNRGNMKRLLIGLPSHYVLLTLRAIVGGFRLEDRIELSGIVGAFAGLAFLFAPRESQ